MLSLIGVYKTFYNNNVTDGTVEITIVSVTKVKTMFGPCSTTRCLQKPVSQSAKSWVSRNGSDIIQIYSFSCLMAKKKTELVHYRQQMVTGRNYLQ